MKKMTKSLLLSLLFAGVSLVAQAAPVDVSKAPVDITQDLLDYSSADLESTFSLAPGVQAGAAGNYFSDKYLFSVTGSNDLVGLITSLKTAPGSGVTLTGFDLRNAGGIVFQGTQDFLEHSAAEQAWGFSSGLYPLAAGSYYIEVNGFVNAATGGSYSGNIGIAPVPEPETYGMLLAGLGVMGLVLRRRRDAIAV